MPWIDKGIDYFYPCLFFSAIKVIIPLVIAVEFYLIYVYLYVYYNIISNNNKLI